MGFTTLQVIAIGMVHRMAALPGEIRHQQQAVQHKSHRSLQATVGMEGTMTALMGDHPATARHGARDQGVEQPEGGGDRCQGDLGAQAVGHQRQAEGHEQASPGLGRLEAEQLRRLAGQQFSLAGEVFCGGRGGARPGAAGEGDRGDQ